MRVYRPFECQRRALFIGVPVAALLIFIIHFSSSSLDASSLRFLQQAQSSSLRAVTTPTKSCLDPNGPQPFILMSIGRSGSGSTFQIIGNLTGLETKAEEYTGSDPIKSTRFFNRIHNDGGLWVTENLCKKQQHYPNAGLVGFKWKPWRSIFSQPALDGLNFIANSQNPTIKIVRLRRNLLDVYLSGIKHRHNARVQAHCAAGDEDCFEKHRLAGSNLTIDVNDAIAYLDTMTTEEDDVDKLLDSMNVPHLHVTYERLYLKEHSEEEWMKIFRFLGVGPSEGLTFQQIHHAMGMESTSNAHHRDSVRNFDELKEALLGTKYEDLLHL